MEITIVECLERVGELRQWIDDLQSGQYVNCIYCGFRYGPEYETPVSRAEMLYQHIRNCPEHPLRAAEEKVTILTETMKRARNTLAAVYALMELDVVQGAIDEIDDTLSRVECQIVWRDDEGDSRN